MSIEIKYAVESLGIPRKKEEMLKNRERMNKLLYEMSKLTFDRTVGLYAYYVDEIDYLISEMNDERKDINKELYFKKLKELDEKATKLSSNENVQKYSMKRDEYYNLLLDNDYYLSVNIGLRKELSKLDLPNIFIKQDAFNFDRNIINPNVFYNDYFDIDSTFILPVYDMKSARDFRHFYNRVSFKYLEELCNDYSFSLEGKKLGKVRIKRVVND